MPDIPIEKFKNDAKSLHKAYIAGDAKAIHRVSAIFNDNTNASLQQVQLVIARENGFSSWPKLRAHFASLSQTSSGGQDESLKGIPVLPLKVLYATRVKSKGSILVRSGPSMLENTLGNLIRRSN